MSALFLFTSPDNLRSTQGHGIDSILQAWLYWTYDTGVKCLK